MLVLPCWRDGDRNCQSGSRRKGIENARTTRQQYPDVSVVCGPRTFEAGTQDVIVNPAILVEVLSKGTEPYDRGLKWDGYQRIDSLTDYLLVAQSHVRIEQFQLNEDGSWTYRRFGAGDRVTLASGQAIDVDTIYADVFTLEGEPEDAQG